MSLVITREDIGDPWAAMERVRKFRAQMLRPKAKYAPVTPPETEQAFEQAEKQEAAERKPSVTIRDKFDADTGTFYKVLIEDGAETRLTSGLAILVEVAQEYGLKVADLKGPSRIAFAVEARRKAFYRLRSETLLSYPQIGRLMGYRDHSTAIYNFHKYKEMRDLGLHDQLLRKGRD